MFSEPIWLVVYYLTRFMLKFDGWSISLLLPKIALLRDLRCQVSFSSRRAGVEYHEGDCQVCQVTSETAYCPRRCVL